ncbi:MAG: hypothetical protein A4E55_00600 [Pelotomaculum sp. PtaU1.Bin035]|nr:MAG: hypothetical protein A4E55_00600 [Pelotomaculum sp. PtaU1.Bin035]
MYNDKFQELVLQQLQALTGGQETLTESQKVLTGSLTKLSDRVDLLTKGQQTLTEGQKQFSQRMERVETSLTRLDMRVENEVENRIHALFDGYSLRGDQIENLQKHFDARLDSIEIDTGYLVSRVARLEKLAK